VIAAWSDVLRASPPSTSGFGSVTSAVATLNVGYIWMLTNCLTSAAYVSKFQVEGKKDDAYIGFDRSWRCAKELK
jgi:hypothetical protein